MVSHAGCILFLRFWGKAPGPFQTLTEIKQKLKTVQVNRFHKQTHFHDSGDLHQWNELGLYAVGQSAGQLGKESFIGPKLLQLLDEHRDKLRYSPEITNQVFHYHRTHLLIRPQWNAARRSRRLRRNWRGSEWGLASAGICPRRSTRSTRSAGNKAPVPGTVCSPLQGLYSNTHPHTHHY